MRHGAIPLRSSGPPVVWPDVEPAPRSNILAKASSRHVGDVWGAVRGESRQKEEESQGEGRGAPVLPALPSDGSTLGNCSSSSAPHVFRLPPKRVGNREPFVLRYPGTAGNPWEPGTVRAHGVASGDRILMNFAPRDPTTPTRPLASRVERASKQSVRFIPMA